MTQAYVSFGSNVNAEDNVRSMIQVFQRRFVHPRFSPVYRSPAVGFVGDDFLNGVVVFDTDDGALAVQQQLKRIEQEHGRDAAQKGFSNRTLDLDLLLYGDELWRTEGLVLPREEIHYHRFVAQPLYDLAPHLCLPDSGLALSEVLAQASFKDELGDAIAVERFFA